MIIRTKSYPRAALIGNPSDGYFGKTIAFVFSNFSADITLYETPLLEIRPNYHDHTVFESMKQLVRNVKKYGYYGGVRLLKAALKKFYEYCSEHSIRLENVNFTIEYSSSIPHSLGLAGSSAIITACMKALMQFFKVDIPKPILANLVLSVEKDELAIPAGLQDRVAQAYEEPVYMNFDRSIMETQGYGDYQTLDARLFKNIFIAYNISLSEGTEVTHNNFRYKYENGDKDVLQAIGEWAELTVKVMDLLKAGQSNSIAPLMNRNFDLRCSVMNINPAHQKMVQVARSVGASAKFTGSGGAIIGTYEDDIMFDVLKVRLNAEGIEVIKPRIVTQIEN